MARALVLVAHGSHLDPDSARPALDHADRIRETGRFDEVHTAFWKEEPSLREVLRTVEADEVVVVPLLMSDGYFANRVFPRELRLDIDGGLDVAKTVAYAEPVGTHDAMTDVVIDRAETVTGDPDVGPGVGLALVGHGTERSETSARSTEYHAERVRETGRFDEVRALFLDEPPYVGDATEFFETDEVVVVPLFVADGYHTTEDIPEELGLSPERGSDGRCATVDGTRLWYAGAVGTEPTLVDVILERAAEAEVVVDGASDADADDTIDAGAPVDAGDPIDAGPSVVTDAREAFLDHLERDAPRTWGELLVDGRADDYELRHRDDRGVDPTALEPLDGPAALRERARFDDEGRYRPLSGAPTLPTGWLLTGLDGDALVRALEVVYPAAIVNGHLERTDRLDVTHYAETADRQTGIYAGVDELTGESLEAAAAAVCGDCVKRRRWDEVEGRELEAPRGEGDLPCREACSFVVSAAREFLDLEGDGEWADDAAGALAAHAGDESSADAPATEARPGEFDAPTNRYRRRFVAERTGAPWIEREGTDVERDSLERDTTEPPCTRERSTS